MAKGERKTVKFDHNNFTDETLNARQQTISYRAFRNIPYVERPADPRLQVLNIFIPGEYTRSGRVGGYEAKTAPIFFPNAIGGYSEAMPGSPAVKEDGSLNAEAFALTRGCVVVSAGARGRETVTDGVFTGKAPASIVDLKAAVRFVRSIADRICGDTGKIVSSGTSAGGAMSALLGASGDAPEYAPLLEELGAVMDKSDSVFAASCYCPITNLEHSDEAYEWQYGHLDRFFRGDTLLGSGGDAVELNAGQMAYAGRLAANFHEYVNTALPGGLDMDGVTWRVCEKLLESARQAEALGTEIPVHSGIMTSAEVVDLRAFSQYITRKKGPGAFDSPDMVTWENQLFGCADADRRHFTAFAAGEDEHGGSSAPESTVAMMNAMNYTGNPGCAKHWRIRHGAFDRDTSFAVPVLLSAALEAEGKEVDFFMPWGVPHSGDYDLGELFDWIDGLCR